jgi:hypothetical protein
MQPARHAYGALLLEQDRQHPGNVWSLHGYHECLARLGEHGQAGIIWQQLTFAAAHADVPIRALC